MFCEKCGKEMPDDAVICTGCGRAMQPVNTMPQRDTSVKRASIGLLLSSVISGYVLAIVGFVLFLVGAGSYDADMYIGFGIVVGIIGIIGIVFGAVLFCMYLYRAWKMIQDGYAYATPREAVGFLFIPFYSLYWYFQAFWRWSKDYNSFIQRNALNAPRMPEGLFLTWAILNVVLSIPYIGVFLGLLPLVVIAIIGTVKICQAVNFFASR